LAKVLLNNRWNKFQYGYYGSHLGRAALVMEETFLLRKIQKMGESEN
jgi:hypothetical protein